MDQGIKSVIVPFWTLAELVVVCEDCFAVDDLVDELDERSFFGLG